MKQICIQCNEWFDIDDCKCPKCGMTMYIQNEPSQKQVQDEKYAESSPQPVFSEQAPQYVNPNSGNMLNMQMSNKANKTKKLWIFLLLIPIAALVIFLIIFNIGKMNLKNLLLKDWSRVEGEGSSLYVLELDFSNNEFDYNFKGIFTKDTIATFQYKVISPNSIKINGRNEVYKIEFNKDKTMMTVKPAITSTDSFEYWFYH